MRHICIRRENSLTQRIKRIKKKNFEEKADILHTLYNNYQGQAVWALANNVIVSSNYEIIYHIRGQLGNRCRRSRGLCDLGEEGGGSVCLRDDVGHAGNASGVVYSEPI